MRSVILLGFFVCASSVLFAQNLPVKMGLWEKTLVTGGSDSAENRTIKAKSCVTPDTWQQMVSNASKQRTNCTNNLVKNSNGYTFDATCTLPRGGSMVAHGTTTIQDAEHIVSETQSTTTMNGKKREMHMHSTSRFLSADCGTVKPGEPEEED